MLIDFFTTFTPSNQLFTKKQPNTWKQIREIV